MAPFRSSFAVKGPPNFKYPLKLFARRRSGNPRIPRASKIEPDGKNNNNIDINDDVDRTNLLLLPRSLAFHVASDSASLRAAASLRAHAFATNLPETISDYARQVYIKERTKEAWQALEARQRGRDDDYRGCVCVCLLGTIDDYGGSSSSSSGEGAFSSGDASDRDDTIEEEEEEDVEEMMLSRAVREAGDASCTLAPLLENKRRRRRRRLAVASLDVIVGRRLPSESLVAECPCRSGSDSGCRIAYLANVAVAPPARRRGLGVALLSRAIEHVETSLSDAAASSVISRIAVHAEARNAAARALYEHASLGFSLEKEESASVEKALNRPRRVLYSRAVSLL